MVDNRPKSCRDRSLQQSNDINDYLCLVRQSEVKYWVNYVVATNLNQDWVVSLVYLKQYCPSLWRNTSWLGSFNSEQVYMGMRSWYNTYIKLKLTTNQIDVLVCVSLKRIIIILTVFIHFSLEHTVFTCFDKT